jgi:hypothetical protein
MHNLSEVGEGEGNDVGLADGSLLGSHEGGKDGDSVGFIDGETVVGEYEGCIDRILEGFFDGIIEECGVDLTLGSGDGLFVNNN